MVDSYTTMLGDRILVKDQNDTTQNGIYDVTTDSASATGNLQGVEVTAAAGSAGNSITISFTTGGTAGSEVVSFIGSAISVQIESGVSTAADIVTSINDAVGTNNHLE